MVNDDNGKMRWPKSSNWFCIDFGRSTAASQCILRVGVCVLRAYVERQIKDVRIERERIRHAESVGRENPGHEILIFG